MDNLKIGQLIAKKRKESGFTQKELGQVLGVTDKAISKWENGFSFPDITLIKRLTEILDINLLDFFNGEEISKKKLTTDEIINIVVDYIDIQERIAKRKARKARNIIISLIAIVIAIILGVFNYIEQREFSPIYCKPDGDVSAWDGLYPDNEAYDLCIASSHGRPIFKNPDAAFSRMKKDYRKELSTVRKNNNLLFITKYNFEDYMRKAWNSSDEDLDCAKVTQILSTYESSFY